MIRAQINKINNIFHQNILYIFKMVVDTFFQNSIIIIFKVMHILCIVLFIT